MSHPASIGTEQETTVRHRPLWLAPFARRAEGIALPVGALLLGLFLFGLFLLILGKSPVEFYRLVWLAGFGTGFSWQNTLTRAAPLLLAALCVALPARLGLVVIGGEGAIVLGGLVTGMLGPWCAPFAATPLSALVAMGGMALLAALAGAIWIGAIGWLRHVRGVNETIASLLMAYIAVAVMNHLVEGPLRDPASLNKPSTTPLVPELMVGPMPGVGVHWGLAVGIVLCLCFWLLIERTSLGFAARLAGGNPRAAALQGFEVGGLILLFTALGGAAAGLAGYYEVAAVQGSANASIAAGYGYTGILIAFLARQNPLAILPVALLLAGLEASSGLVQRRMDMPDATILVLKAVVFIVILVSDTLYGRFRLFAPERWTERWPENRRPS